MKPSLLTYFAWISLVVLVSCASPKVILTGDQYEFSSSSFDKVTYKADVRYRDQEISGRVLVKKTGVENYRVAFYNELGITYLEGTLERKKLIVQNIIPILDNRLFLRKFKSFLIEII